MSFMDTFIEKSAIVIDIGNAFTKCGFSGDREPHSIIPTKVFQSSAFKTASSSNRGSASIYDYKTLVKKSINAQLSNEEVECLKEILNEFMYRVYYKILNANSKERKVVVVDSIFTTNQFRKVLWEVLVKNFQASSVIFISTHVASLYTLGTNTALVIDCGYTDCQILPIADGVQLVGLCNFVDLGAKRLHNEIEKILRKYAFITVGNVKQPFASVEPQPELTEDIIEDIKLRCCFVTSFTRSRQIYSEIEAKSVLKYEEFNQLEFKFAPDCEYSLANNLLLTIPGFLRETIFEILFIDKEEARQTIPNLILDTILKSPIDLKKTLISNVVLIGGGCMLNGFKNRLADELKHLLATGDDYKDSLPYKEIKFLVAPSLDNYTGWLGGSIYGELYGVLNTSNSLSNNQSIDMKNDLFN